MLEEDDGSGWVKVADAVGGRGLVPASYVELLDASEVPVQRSATPTPGNPQSTGNYGMSLLDVRRRALRREGSLPRLLSLPRGVTVRGIYAYTAQGPDELDVEEGKLIQLTDGPSGGRNYADGWWEGARVHLPSFGS